MCRVRKEEFIISTTNKPWLECVFHIFRGEVMMFTSYSWFITKPFFLYLQDWHWKILEMCIEYDKSAKKQLKAQVASSVGGSLKPKRNETPINLMTDACICLAFSYQDPCCGNGLSHQDCATHAWSHMCRMSSVDAAKYVCGQLSTWARSLLSEISKLAEIWRVRRGQGLFNIWESRRSLVMIWFSIWQLHWDAKFTLLQSKEASSGMVFCGSWWKV